MMRNIRMMRRLRPTVKTFSFTAQKSQSPVLVSLGYFTRYWNSVCALEMACHRAIISWRSASTYARHGDSPSTERLEQVDPHCEARGDEDHARIAGASKWVLTGEWLRRTLSAIWEPLFVVLPIAWRVMCSIRVGDIVAFIHIKLIHVENPGLYPNSHVIKWKPSSLDPTPDTSMEYYQSSIPG